MNFICLIGRVHRSREFWEVDPSSNLYANAHSPLSKSSLRQKKKKKTKLRENDVTRLDEHEQVCFPALKEQLGKNKKTACFHSWLLLWVEKAELSKKKTKNKKRAAAVVSIQPGRN